MTIDEQILKTEQEYEAYRNANFAAPEIIEWLDSVLESLYELKNLK